jgi:hypothetical protein
MGSCLTQIMRRRGWIPLQGSTQRRLRPPGTGTSTATFPRRLAESRAVSGPSAPRHTDRASETEPVPSARGICNAWSATERWRAMRRATWSILVMAGVLGVVGARGANSSPVGWSRDGIMYRTGWIALPTGDIRDTPMVIEAIGPDQLLVVTTDCLVILKGPRWTEQARASIRYGELPRILNRRFVVFSTRGSPRVTLVDSREIAHPKTFTVPGLRQLCCACLAADARSLSG